MTKGITMFAYLVLLILLLPLAVLASTVESLFSTHELLEMGICIENPFLDALPVHLQDLETTQPAKTDADSERLFFLARKEIHRLHSSDIQ